MSVPKSCVISGKGQMKFLEEEIADRERQVLRCVWESPLNHLLKLVVLFCCTCLWQTTHYLQGGLDFSCITLGALTELKIGQSWPQRTIKQILMPRRIAHASFIPEWIELHANMSVHNMKTAGGSSIIKAFFFAAGKRQLWVSAKKGNKWRL